MSKNSVAKVFEQYGEDIMIMRPYIWTENMSCIKHYIVNNLIHSNDMNK